MGKEQKKLFIVAIIIVTIGSIAAAYLFFSEKLFVNGKKESANLNRLDPGSAIANHADWKKYADTTNGFEIEYDPRSIVSFDASLVPEFPCGSKIGQTTLISDNNHSDTPLYRIAVYTNPQNTELKDFFICKNKAQNDKFNESSIISVESTAVGEQKKPAVILSLSGSNDIALVSANGNVYEIIRSAEKASRDELVRMLASLKFNDRLIVDNQETLKKFCQDSTVNSERRMLIFAAPLTEPKENAKEYFIGCAAEISTQKEILFFHISKNNQNNFEIVWQANSGDDFVARKKTPPEKDFMNAFSTGDIDNDRFDELLLTFGESGGICGADCNDNCIYSPTQRKNFCVSSCTGWIDRKDLQGADCPVMDNMPRIESDNCPGEKFHHLCFFDPEMASEKNKIYRDYLLKTTNPDI